MLMSLDIWSLICWTLDADEGSTNGVKLEGEDVWGGYCCDMSQFYTASDEPELGAKTDEVELIYGYSQEFGASRLCSCMK
jgi:hypothetical protein